MAGPRRGFARSAATTPSPSIARARERGEIKLEAGAQIMEVSVMTALRMVRHGIIKGRQLCRGAPWVIKAEDMAAYREQNASRRPLTSDSNQHSLKFQ